VLLVHGIGPFDAERSEEAARSVIARTRPEAEVVVQSFDWRSVVGGTIRRTHLDPNVMGSFGAAWHELTLDRLLPESQAQEAAPGLASALLSLYHFAATLLPLLLLALLLADSRACAAPPKTAGKATTAAADSRAGRSIPDPESPSFWGLARRAATLLTACLMAVAASLQLFRRGRSAAARSTALLFPWIWSVLLALMVLPYLLVQMGRRRELRRQGLILGTAGALGVASLTRLTRSESWQIGLVATAFAVLLLGVLAGPAIVRRGSGLAIRLLQTPVGIGLMFIADVVRYLGDGIYRSNLQALLGERLRIVLDTRPRELVIAAHSLGSVIAADALRIFKVLVPAETRVTLLTMGSPLKRTFRRFFPDRYPSPAALREVLAADVGPFRWLNVHRPFDPVGTELFGGPPADRTAGRFRWTWPFQLFIPAHVEYWGDSDVLDQALEGIGTMPFSPAPPPTSPMASPLGPSRRWRNSTRHLAAQLLAVAATGTTAIWLYPFCVGSGDGRFASSVILLLSLFLLYQFVYSPYLEIAFGYSPDPETFRSPASGSSDD
jgi:hypothetical protein